MILEDLNIVNYYPKLHLLPLNFSWLLFYVYVQKISILSSKKASFWVLYPGCIFLISQCILFFLPINQKIIIENSVWSDLFSLLGLFYSLWIGMLTIRWINNHVKELENQYASLEYKQLRWARLFVIFGILFMILYIIVSLIIDTEYLEIIFSVVNVILLYWISIRGVLQYNIKSVIPESLPKSSLNNPLVIDKKVQKESSKNLKLIIDNLETYFLESFSYTQQELTINDVSKFLEIHPRLLSTAINSVCNKNFNTYVNSFRIQKAQELIKNGTTESLSLEGIGNEVGFQSKSTFYGAFKKLTEMIPLEFKNTKELPLFLRNSKIKNS